MKKFLAVAVVLAFVAGGAFAISFNGDVMGGAVLMSGSTADGDDDIMARGFMHRTRLAMEGSTAEGTFGALARFQAAGFTGAGASITTHTAIGWWQPAPMFWLALGIDSDGLFSADGNSQWMFYREHGDIGVVNPGNAWGGLSYVGFGFENSFYGGFDALGLSMTIRPMPELFINIALPIMDSDTAWGEYRPGEGWINWDDPRLGWDGPRVSATPIEVGDMFASLHFQAVFAQAWGNVALTYVGDHSDASNGSIFAYLNLRMVDNLDLDFGLGFHLYDDPLIGIGVAAAFDISADFGLRARAQFTLDTMENAPSGILFDVVPFFSITDNIRVFCGLGVAVDLGEDDTAFNFHVAPHIVVGGDWAPRFFAGFRLESANDFGDDTVMRWSVPLGLVVNF